MKGRSSIFAAIAVLAAGVAHADVCSEVWKIAQHAESGFAPFRGQYDPLLETYAATITLPSAYECNVDLDEDDWKTYGCKWYKSTEQRALSDRDALATALQRCPQWQVTSVRSHRMQSPRSRSEAILIRTNRDFRLSVSARYTLPRARRPEGLASVGLTIFAVVE